MEKREFRFENYQSLLKSPIGFFQSELKKGPTRFRLTYGTRNDGRKN